MIHFGIIGGGAGITTPPAEPSGEWYINEATSTGTYTFALIEDGFEMELYGDGTVTTSPIALSILDTTIPTGTSGRYTYDIELLSGTNPLYKQTVVSDGTLYGDQIAPGSYDWSGTTSNNTTNSAFWFDETIAGKVRITNVNIYIDPV